MKRTAKLSSKHQLTIPAWARRKLGLKPGSRLALRAEADRLILERVEVGLAPLRGALRDVYGDAKAYLGEVRGEWARES